MKARLVPAGMSSPSLGSCVKCGAAAPTTSTLTSLERSHSAKSSPKGYAGSIHEPFHRLTTGLPFSSS